MIFLNETPIKINRFPDKTLSVFNFPSESININSINKIDWRYEDDSELFTLLCCVKHLREIDKNINLNLFVPYLPHSRMDRVKDRQKELFTLKYFAEFINSLKFDKVYVLDPHSDVSVALLNNVVVKQDVLNMLINKALNSVYYIEQKNPVIYFPDAGAAKRYSSMECFKNYEYIYGVKTRDWKTGKINGVKICNKDGIVIQLDNNILENASVLMVDDIVSYGGTLAHSADKLKELGVGNIYAYVTHAENSVVDEEKSSLLEKFKDETVKMLFTSDSIFNKDSEYVNVIKI